jgi:shikimate kinase
MDASNRDRIKASGIVIYLHASVEEQLKRTAKTQHRPLLRENPRQVLERLMAARSPLYEQLADLRLDTTGRHVGAVAVAARDLLRQRGLLPLKN